MLGERWDLVENQDSSSCHACIAGPLTTSIIFVDLTCLLIVFIANLFFPSSRCCFFSWAQRIWISCWSEPVLWCRSWTVQTILVTWLCIPYFMGCLTTFTMQVWLLRIGRSIHRALMDHSRSSLIASKELLVIVWQCTLLMCLATLHVIKENHLHICSIALHTKYQV